MSYTLTRPGGEAPCLAGATEADASLLFVSPLNDPALLRFACGGAEPDALYLMQGWLALDPAERPRLSYWFDAAFYLESQPDVAAARVDPYLHFLREGFAEGRDPHALIELRFARAQALRLRGAWSLEVLADGLRDNSLQPHPLFDVAYYLQSNPDVRDSGMPALLHYLECGAVEGRRPVPLFDADWHMAAYPQVPRDRLGAFLHFVRSGDREGLSPVPTFDGRAYLDARSDVAAAGIGALAHLLEWGQAETPAAAQPEPQEPALAEAAAPLPAAAPHGTLGRLELVQNGFALGWAFDPARPELRLGVEVLCGDRVVGRGTADLPRSDLRENGIGDGSHHFRVRLSDELGLAGSGPLRARADGASLEGELESAAPPPAWRGFDVLPGATLRELATASWRDRGDASAFTAALLEVNLLLETHEPGEALKALQALEAQYPAETLLQLKLGECLLGLAQWESAAAAYRRARDLPQTAAWSWLGEGNARRLQGEWQEAEACYRAGAALEPLLPAFASYLVESDFHAVRLEARRRAAAGEAASAMALLVPELLAKPRDSETAAFAAGLSGCVFPDGSEPELSAAMRSRVLLDAMLDHIDTMDGAR